MYYERGNERKALAHFGRAMEYGAGTLGLLDLPPEILDKIMLEVMRSAMEVASVNKQTARAAIGIVNREKRVFVQYHKSIDLSCARALSTKTTLEWLEFCDLAAAGAGAGAADTARAALEGRAVREFEEWYELVAYRLHDLVDIANAQGIGINSESQQGRTAKDLLGRAVSGFEKFLPQPELEALNAVVGGARHEPVTDVRASFGSHLYGPTFLWDTRQVTSLRKAFAKLGTLIAVGLWDTSNVTDMSDAFAEFTGSVFGLERWNVSRVTTMNGAFLGCASFDGDIGDWDTSKVTDMSFMFYGASSFNKPIGRWNTSKVTNMRSMFNGASAFDQHIGRWDTGSVAYMPGMFESATKFNGGIGRWKTENVTDMSRMFTRARAFNADIGNWNTENVTDMSLMFSGARSFNQDLSRWDLRRCVALYKMFYKGAMIERNKPLIGIRIAYYSGAEGVPKIEKACRLWSGQAPCEKNCSVGSMRPGSMCRLAVVVVPVYDNAGVIDVKLNATVLRSLVGANSAVSPGDYKKHVGELNSAIRGWRGLKSRRLVFSVYPSEHAARTLATKTTLEWLEFCERAVKAVKAAKAAKAAKAERASGAADTARDALEARAAREFEEWPRFAPYRLHDLVDIANAQGVGISADVQQRGTAKGLLDQLVGALEVLPAAELAALRAVVGGTRYVPVTDARASFGKPEYGPTFLWDTRGVRSLRKAFAKLGADDDHDRDGIVVGLWDTSNVTDMSSAFEDFTGSVIGLERWNVSRVTTMIRAFAGCESFDADIGDWDTSNVTDMSDMFRGASTFDKPIGHWDTSNVTDMSHMFEEARSFNQPIGLWDTSRVERMMFMFHSARSFNQPIGDWDTSSVYDMDSMFDDAREFNQPIEKWDTSNVRSMNMMFYGARSFDRNISNWNVSSCTSAIHMFDESGMKEQNKAARP
jgi:surface protein